MNCKIDMLQHALEKAWIVTIALEDVHKLIIELTAYEYGKVHEVVLYDNISKLSVGVKRIRHNPRTSDHSLALGKNSISINRTWLDAVMSMLLEVYLFGWSETAHLDYEFLTSEGVVSISINVTLSEMSNDTH